MSKTGRGIAYSLVFLLCFFVFDRLAFHAIRSVERRASEKQSLRSLFVRRHSFYRNFFSLPRGTFDTVIMGSSRTHRGIHPYYLYRHAGLSAFKIASAHGRPKFNYYFYQSYRKYAGPPALLVYGLDYFMFTTKTKAPFLHPLTSQKDSALEARGLSRLWSNKAQIDELLAEFLNLFAGEDEDADGAGTVLQRSGLPAGAAHIHPFIGYRKLRGFDGRRPPRFERFTYKPFPGREGRWFLKLLRQLERDGVTVVLVNLPSFIGTHESIFQHEEFMADIGRLAAPLRGVHLLDYDRPDRFDLKNEEYFLDGGYGLINSHLSFAGAHILNRRLAADLKKLLGR